MDLRKGRSRKDERRYGLLAEALRQMNSALNSLRLYPAAHAEVKAALQRLREVLARSFQEAEEVGFGFIDGYLYIDGVMSVEETALNQNLLRCFSLCRIEYLLMSSAVTAEELSAFFQFFAAEAVKPSGMPPSLFLRTQGIRTIKAVEAEVADASGDGQPAARKPLPAWYAKAAATLGDVQRGFARGQAPGLEAMGRLVDDMLATIHTKGHAPFLLLPLVCEGADPHLAHGVNAAVLAAAMGLAHGLNAEQLRGLCVAALLHDMGRLVIPLEWIDDPTPLSAEERAVVRQSGDWSYLLLTGHPELPVQAGLTAAHLRGGSFPAGGYRPDVMRDLVALACDYDLACVSERRYWRQQRKDRMLSRILRLSGERYAPTLVKLLVQCVGFYPVGSLVRLDDGQRAVVVRPNPMHPARPKVYLFEAAEPAAAPEGREPPPAVLDLCDLTEGGVGFRRSIVARLAPEPPDQARRVVARRAEPLLSFAL